MGGGNLNVDHLTVLLGAADAVSARCSAAAGGVHHLPATGAAPPRGDLRVIMMGIMALILFFGLLPFASSTVQQLPVHSSLWRRRPLSPLPRPAARSSRGHHVRPAVFDPFFGMLAGIVLKLIIGFTGLIL